MSAETTTTRKRMGLTTIISSIIIVSSLVWATYSFGVLQFGVVRDYDPHYKYDDIEYWPYDNNFTGGNTNWFDNINYTRVPLDLPLPDDLLDRLDDTVFVVEPQDPGQLWRTGAYDLYDGLSWGKSDISNRFLYDEELITYPEATNTIYTIYFYATAGASVGSIELPTIFPNIRVIEDSFKTYSLVDDTTLQEDNPSRLLSYDLQTDIYGTLLLNPFIQGTTGDDVLMSYDLTFVDQDIDYIIANARDGASAPQYTRIFKDLSLVSPLSDRVIDNVTPFQSLGNNAYEKAMAVQVYFQSTFNLIIDEFALSDRPVDQETTDWFLERGGGLPMDFATAYCVFMRQLDIPARLVMGYALGERTPPDQRTVMVRHMQFWAEVYIPTAGGDGEWIQVIPTPLPDRFGGGEDPENTPIPDVELLIWPTSGQPWAIVGDSFNLSTSLTVEGIPVTTPETLVIYDELDQILIGLYTVGEQISYTFPSDATIDYHIISATWQTAELYVVNATSVYAVGTPSPYSSPTFQTEAGGFILSETRQLNVSQGLDTHVAYWEDTVHVYGTMKIGDPPIPVNSSNYDNRNIGIYWDDTFMGNATIDEYGYYELYIYVNPMDFSLMTVGTHRVWSWYLGDWDDEGFPRLTEAFSDDNNITVWGRVGFDLYVYPTDIAAGETVYYDGAVYFLNGTYLPSGEEVGVFFSSQASELVSTNSTGGFQWSYNIPVTQPDGSYFAYANWTSSWPFIEGNWSISIEVIVGSSGTQLSIYPDRDPLYVAEIITIHGYLTHVSNGTGIGGRLVDIYWNNGTTFHLGSVSTAPDGYYELIYTILVSDEGPVEFWSNFTSSESTLASSESEPHIFSNVKKWDVSLDPIFVTPDPVFLLQPVDIQGNATLPEFSLPLANEWVDIWLENSTDIYWIGSALTNSSGGYFFQYIIPIDQLTEMVYIWANYTSTYYYIYDGPDSVHEDLLIEATDTLISIQDDFTFYYVNETILLYGNLQFANGTPIPFQIVDIYWTNSSGTYPFQKETDAFGNYQMIYNCSPTKDDPETITVDVYWTSYTPEFDDAFSSLSPPIQLQRYDLEITITAPTQLYVDELDFDIQGILTYLGGFPPVTDEWVDIYYHDGMSWVPVDAQLTNSSGGFLSPLTFGTYDDGIVNFAAVFWSPDLLHNNATTFFSITRVKYAVNLEVTLDFNPVMQNETLTIHAYLYFAHNGTQISDADILIYWENSTLPIPFLGTITTDGTGQGDLPYSGMKYDTDRFGIHVYGIFTGTIFLGTNESIHNILTLEQWSTGIFGVNVPVTVYRLTETVIVTGTLEYDIAAVPYSGATVELTLFGITQAVDVTDIFGDFSISWTIPSSTIPGFYDLLVEFNSPYPWIADSSAPVPQIEIIAPGYLWPSFNVAPSPVYLGKTLAIWGTVTWDNGSLYPNSPVDFYWGDPFGTWELIQLDWLTDGSGNFYYEFSVPADTPLGDRQVWAYIDPVGYATSGMSPTLPITVAIITVDLTATVDLTIVYLNQAITFSGNLQFTNTSPMVDYEVEIWWGGELLTTETTLGTGDFSYIYTLQWDDDIGPISGYALFRPPDISFGTLDILEPFSDVTVLERVDVFLDPVPIINTVSRGDTLQVTGYVLNDGGFAADSVRVEALYNHTPTGFTAVTTSDGSFTININVLQSVLPGTYNISVYVISPYHDMRNGPVAWFIDVYIASEVDVQINQVSIMPGESFSVDVQLFDDDANPLDEEWVTLSLGSTNIANIQITDPSGRMTIVLAVPLSWAEGDGFFTITANYAGGSFIDPDSFESTNSIHVFTEVDFQPLTPRRIDPGARFSLEVALLDPSGNPIVNREVRLTLNGTDNYPLFTGSDGIVSYGLGPYTEGTSISFTLTLLSTEVTPVFYDGFTINIQTVGDNPLQGADLLIAGILLIGAVVAVLAYLYIVKGMFRSTVISRGIDIPTKLRNIKKLADAGKYGASITLAYRTFEQMCGTKIGSERSHNETAREYLDRVLQTIPLDLATVEQFVQTYEEARFSHHEMTRERYEDAVRIFTDLYPRIDSTAPVE